MKSDKVLETIKTWRLPHIGNIELHRGTSVTRDCPRHWHNELHLCLIEAGGGELHYRRAIHHTPSGSLFIVQPAEVHANRTSDETGCTYRNLYVDPDLLLQTAKELDQRRSLPLFPQAVLFDHSIVRLYREVHQTLEVSACHLEQESLLLRLLVYLISNYSEKRPFLQRAGRERQAVRCVRDYLTDNYADNVSLARLAQIANLSPFHLTRVFCLELGLPPHAYQTQVRVIKAKELLHRGWEISSVALATGFADQSHLTRHFKRLIGVPPGEYRKHSKNIQDRYQSMD